MAIVLAAWMLDPAICATMSLGPPAVDIARLAELDWLLRDLGLRRACSAEPLLTEEVHHVITVASGGPRQAIRQLAMALDRPVLNGMTVEDRNIVVRRLARLLIEAAGVDPKDRSRSGRGDPPVVRTARLMPHRCAISTCSAAGPGAQTARRRRCCDKLGRFAELETRAG